MLLLQIGKDHWDILSLLLFLCTGLREHLSLYWSKMSLFLYACYFDCSWVGIPVLSIHVTFNKHDPYPSGDLEDG